MPTRNDNLTIGEVARQAGVPASTLRYWESAGLLTAPGRVSGKRRYDPQTLRQISLIVLIKRAGFTLAETRIVLSGLSDRTPPPDIWRKLAKRKLPEIKQTLAEARAMKKILEEGLRCDCLTLDDCLRQGGSRTAAHRPVSMSAQK
ncbi:MAG TPA: MerR family transcriptional regulator [Solirubrobacteraceae bacterium]|jgi:MerR family redox-sensitive transcriptional activator SoxR